jgi:hypothetical protein
MLYQIGVTLKQLQTASQPEKLTLFKQPEFFEADSPAEAVLKYCLANADGLKTASPDIYLISINYGNNGKI